MNFEERPVFVPGGETQLVLKKRVLMGILARHEAERAGVAITREDVEVMTRWFRARFDLLRREDVEAFLDFAGLSRADFSRAMRTFATVEAVEAHHAAHIAEELPTYRATLSVRDFILRREGLEVSP
ncbi:MAG: hypothetical protein U0271_31565 [Polyangiaceae bacterium]